MGRSTTFKDTRKTIDLYKTRFNKNVNTRQKDMWSAIYKGIRKLKTDESGNILTTTENLKLMRTLRGDVERSIITPQYKKDLNKFTRGFDDLKDINDKYYKAIASGTLNANKNVFNTVNMMIE